MHTWPQLWVFALVHQNATSFLWVFRTLVFIFHYFCWFDQQLFCIYPWLYLWHHSFHIHDGDWSTGTNKVWKRPQSQHWCWLKKEPEVDASGLSYKTPDWQSSQCSSPQRDLFTSNPCHLHCCLSDNYCLLISIQLEKPSDKTAAGVSIPTGALMDKIIRLYLCPIIADITQIVVLSNTDFLVYKGRWSKGKGMTYNEVATYLRDLVGSQDWVWFPVIIRATPLMLGESKMWISNAKEFVRTLTLSKTQQEQLTDRDAAWEDQEWAWLYWWHLEMQKELEKKIQKPHSVYVTPDLSPARRQHTDDKPAKSVSEHFDPEPSEQSLGSHSSSDSDPQTDTNDDSDTSHQTMTSNRDHHWDKAQWWDWRRGKRGRWQKTNHGKLSLPIYWDSQKDDAISYDDWHCEVDALIQWGHSQWKIKMVILNALEGRPKRTAQVACTDHKGCIGRGKLYKILDFLENFYGRSVTYQSLIGELCSIHQKQGETPESCYEWLMTIVLLLCEWHGECIKVKELDSTAKDSFYSGLHQQYQALVTHLKDKAHMTASDLLKAIQVHEEAESNLRDR